MAAYRQIVQNHSAAASAESDDSSLHQALVEKVIVGADVVQAAIHLTAATLAAMSPSVRFEQMQLHTLRLGTEAQENLQGKESRDVYLGSLDWLESSEIQSFFSATEEQVGATTGTGSIVQLPRANLVISNPPFTRRGSVGQVRYIVSIKSGPNWGNSSQIAKLRDNFAAAIRVIRQGNRTANVIAVNGCCYGRETRPDKGEYFKYCGQEFWELISDDVDF